MASNAPKLTPALDGYVWCEKCQAPQPAKGHTCRELVSDPPVKKPEPPASNIPSVPRC